MLNSLNSHAGYITQGLLRLLMPVAGIVMSRMPATARIGLALYTGMNAGTVVAPVARFGLDGIVQQLLQCTPIHRESIAMHHPPLPQFLLHPPLRQSVMLPLLALAARLVVVGKKDVELATCTTRHSLPRPASSDLLQFVPNVKDVGVRIDVVRVVVIGVGVAPQSSSSATVFGSATWGWRVVDVGVGVRTLPLSRCWGGISVAAILAGTACSIVVTIITTTTTTTAISMTG
mmetsp:Transcript_33634/g.72837  ORF Transcript_33634/g.72837 Transcript_33634/m.72837 type:complete len:232 (-) Transcript_33634:1087-1782(-)